MATTSLMEHDKVTEDASLPHSYTVQIHPCVDTTGYWAESVSLPGCFTDGETIQETEANMFEAMDLFLRDGSHSVQNYSLRFEVKDA